MVGEVLISAEQIAQRIAAMGRQISEDYADKTPVMIAILKGSFIFLSDLVRAVDPAIGVEMDFMIVSSYGTGTESTGIIQIKHDCAIDVAGRDVLIVEDIVDTGQTLHHIRNLLLGRNARSVRIAAMLHKPSREIRKVPLDYVGFTIENKFVIGYGLDRNELYRHYKDIRYIP